MSQPLAWCKIHGNPKVNARSICSIGQKQNEGKKTIGAKSGKMEGKFKEGLKTEKKKRERKKKQDNLRLVYFRKGVYHMVLRSS